MLAVFAATFFRGDRLTVSAFLLIGRAWGSAIRYTGVPTFTGPRMADPPICRNRRVPIQI